MLSILHVILTCSNSHWFFERTKFSSESGQSVFICQRYFIHQRQEGSERGAFARGAFAQDHVPKDRASVVCLSDASSGNSHRSCNKIVETAKTEHNTTINNDKAQTLNLLKCFLGKEQHSLSANVRLLI